MANYFISFMKENNKIRWLDGSSGRSPFREEEKNEQQIGKIIDFGVAFEMGKHVSTRWEQFKVNLAQY
jgi:hypothetical protein